MVAVMGHPSIGAVDEDIRGQISALVKRQGLYPTARMLSTSREALGSYLAGSARAGTTLLIQTLWTHLYAKKHATETAEAVPEVEMSEPAIPALVRPLPRPRKLPTRSEAIAAKKRAQG